MAEIDGVWLKKDDRIEITFILGHVDPLIEIKFWAFPVS